MRKLNWQRWALILTGSAVLLNGNGCTWNDFWIGLAGVGGIASGLVNLFVV